MSIQIVITADHTQEIIAKAHEAVAAAVRDAAAQLESRAKEMAPVRTGALRDSIHTEMDGDLVAQVGSDLDYSVYQEYGTSRMPAHPFMTPAAEEARQIFEDDLRGIAESLS